MLGIVRVPTRLYGRGRQIGRCRAGECNSVEDVRKGSEMGSEDLALQQKAWSFLASVFNDLPDRDFVEKLRSMESGQSGQDACDANGSWLEGLSDDEALDALGRDRARLMRYVDDYCIRPPYESLYTGRKENETLYGLHEFFLKAGFSPKGEYKDPADYIGMELAFLAECCSGELAALEAGDMAELDRLQSIREEFIVDHASAWIPQYAQEMRQAAQTGFYKDVAEMLLDIFQAMEAS